MNRSEIVDTANDIVDEYRTKYGLVLTLRQLFYQFVRRGYLPNDNKIYKKIGAALTEARLNGSFPLDGLEDRGRTVGHTDAECSDDVDEAITQAANSLSRLPHWIRYGRWHEQPVKVSVWIEKEALAGVVEGICGKLGVGLFPCRGYPSISSLAYWVRTTHAILEAGDEAVILYLGDHDPDGLQIPITAHETIRKIMGLEGTWFPCQMDRIALTMAQIRQYNPPPMPAKKTSARYKRYFQTTGITDAWELDALDPPQLQSLVKTHVGNYFNDTTHQDNRQEIADLRAEMVDRMADDPSWLEAQLRRHF